MSGDDPNLPQYIAHIVFQTVDTVTTIRIIHGGGREANPFLAAVAEHHPAAFVAVKAAITASIVTAAHAASKVHPRAATWLLVALNALYAFTVWHNLN